MADITSTLPATSPPSLVVDQDAAGNTIPTSKITTGAAGVNGGFVAPSNPLPVGFQDTGGNSQQPQLRLVNGVWTISVEDEHPYRAIIDTAKSKGCDLIVMASHGRHGISAIVLGSETVKVLTHSKIPVLVHR